MSKRQPNFGSELRRLREQTGLGIKKASKELGVSYAYLSRIENDHRTPSPALVEKLSDLYGIDPEEMLARLHELPPDIRNILETHGKEVFDTIRKLYPASTKARK